LKQILQHVVTPHHQAEVEAQGAHPEVEVAVVDILVMTQMMVENKRMVEWVEQKILDKKYL
jgi:hypothetical protein